jgi:hypothetical protein
MTRQSGRATAAVDLADAATWRVNAAIEAGLDDLIDEIVAESGVIATNV